MQLLPWRQGPSDQIAFPRDEPPVGQRGGLTRLGPQ